MSSPDVIAAVQGSESWEIVTAPKVLSGYVRAIRVTACADAGATLTVMNSAGATVSTGMLGLHVLEPMIGIKEIVSLGDATEVRVYYGDGA